MKQTLQIRLGQRLAMTPRMRSAIRLLQLSTLELRGELSQMLESNVMLEMDNERPDEDWGGGPVHGREAVGPDALPGPEPSLRDRLLWQLASARFSDEDHLIAMVIVDSIDERGYLDGSMDDLLGALAQLGLRSDPGKVERVLRRVQRFDPPGVAARSLSECLLRQLEETDVDVPYRDLAMRIAGGSLEALARRGLADLARHLRTTRADLDGALSLLRTLNPRPGAGLTGAPTEYVTPELRAYRSASGWRVELNSGAVPQLRINPVYADLVRRSRGDREYRSVREHLSEARWLIRSLGNRNETLLRVARAIVRHQEAFLERGEEAMQPLAQREIATELALHESTVSRVTSRKYVQTPRGVLELKSLFSNQVPTAEGGTVSAAAIRAHLRRIIADEEAGRARSDRHLASDLEQAGFRIARRTVAKYRESMGIPPSNTRRRMRAAHLNASA